MSMLLQPAASTEVPELQDVEGPKSMALLPTAQTPGLNWLKFVLGVPQWDTFRGIEGIFEFHPRSRVNDFLQLISEHF